MTKISHKNLQWIDLIKPSREELKKLRGDFNFHELDIGEVLSRTQRAKIEKYKSYIFIVLLFPIFNRKTRAIESSEIDFFVGENFLVTCHHGNLPPLLDIVSLCSASEEAKEKCLIGKPQMLLYNLLNKLFLYCYPILDHVNLDIAEIEKKIFSGQERQTVAEILMIRRNITDMRRIMQAHKNTLKKLSKDGIAEEDAPYFDSLIDYAKEIWDLLEACKESIEALQQTNESLISFKLRDVIRILTIISVIFIPANFIAFIFGVNTTNAPAHDFWVILLIAVIASVLMFVLLRRKKWL